MSFEDDFDADFEDLDMDIEDTLVDSGSDQTQKITPGTKVTVIFRSTIGPEKIEKMQVDMDMAIMELKQTIGTMYGLAAEDFHLSILGRTADNEDVLANYEITEGAEILIIPVSTAGSGLE